MGKGHEWGSDPRGGIGNDCLILSLESPAVVLNNGEGLMENLTGPFRKMSAVILPATV